MSHFSPIHHQLTSTHLKHCLSNSLTTSTTSGKRKSDNTDNWSIQMLTCNSSDNTQSTSTLVFPPSYRLITELTKSHSIPFFLTAHSNIFLGTLSKDFPKSTKHMYNFFPLAQYSSCRLLMINTTSTVHYSDKKTEINFISSH